MKVLLLNLPRYKDSSIVREECCWGPIKGGSTKVVPFPFHLAQIGGCLRDHAQSVETKLFDANSTNAGFREIGEYIKRYRPDLVICAIIPELAPFEAQIAKLCKGMKVECVGIACPSGYAKDFAKKYSFTFTIYSEPEKVILDYVNGIPREKLRGVVYHKDGEIVKNPEQKPSFSKLPAPDMDLFDFKKYTDFVYQFSRGCPYHCKFCIWAGLPWQVKPVERVVQDLSEMERRGVRLVQLLGAQISTNKKWVNGFCDELKKRGVKIMWTTDIRANEVDRSMVQNMRSAGCVGVYMGVESPKQKILDYLDKRLTPEQIREAITICMEEGIPITIPILFNIGESDDDVDEYVRFVLKTKPNAVSTGIVKVYKGTKLFMELPSDHRDNVDTYGEPMLTLRGVKQALRRMQRFRDGIKSVNRTARIRWFLTNKNALKTALRLYSPRMWGWWLRELA